MKFTAGDVSLDTNKTLLLSFVVAPIYSPRQEHIRDRKQIQIEGLLTGANPGALTTAINAVEEQFRTFNGDTAKDVGLYEDDGTATNHVLVSSGAHLAPRLTNLEWLEGRGAEYATRRSFRASFEAEYNVSGAPSLLAYEDTYEIIGTGGQRFAHSELISGLAIQEVVNSNTVARAIQRGQAIGRTAYPSAASPIGSSERGDLRQVGTRGPQWNGTAFTNFVRTWSYVFERNTPYTGTAPSV